MTEAGHTPPELELVKPFLVTAYELRDDPHHPEGLLSMYTVGHQMSLLRRAKDKKDRDLLEQITQLHIRLGHLVSEPNTEEVGLFRFTPKGLEMAQRWLREG
jgi:hypothetical protein